MGNKICTCISETQKDCNEQDIYGLNHPKEKALKNIALAAKVIEDSVSDSGQSEYTSKDNHILKVRDIQEAVNITDEENVEDDHHESDNWKDDLTKNLKNHFEKSMIKVEFNDTTARQFDTCRSNTKPTKGILKNNKAEFDITSKLLQNGYDEINYIEELKDNKAGNVICDPKHSKSNSQHSSIHDSKHFVVDDNRDSITPDIEIEEECKNAKAISNRNKENTEAKEEIKKCRESLVTDKNTLNETMDGAKTYISNLMPTPVSNLKDNFNSHLIMNVKGEAKQELVNEKKDKALGNRVTEKEIYRPSLTQVKEFTTPKSKAHDIINSELRKSRTEHKKVHNAKDIMEPNTKEGAKEALITKGRVNNKKLIENKPLEYTEEDVEIIYHNKRNLRQLNRNHNAEEESSKFVDNDNVTKDKSSITHDKKSRNTIKNRVIGINFKTEKKNEGKDINLSVKAFKIDSKVITNYSSLTLHRNSNKPKTTHPFTLGKSIWNRRKSLDAKRSCEVSCSSKDFCHLQSILIKHNPGIKEQYLERWCKLTKASFSYYTTRHIRETKPTFTAPLKYVDTVKRVEVSDLDNYQFEIILKVDIDLFKSSLISSRKSCGAVEDSKRSSDVVKNFVLEKANLGGNEMSIRKGLERPKSSTANEWTPESKEEELRLVLDGAHFESQREKEEYRQYKEQHIDDLRRISIYNKEEVINNPVKWSTREKEWAKSNKLLLFSSESEETANNWVSMFNWLLYKHYTQ